jgi:hypothetical protein
LLIEGRQYAHRVDLHRVVAATGSQHLDSPRPHTAYGFLLAIATVTGMATDKCSPASTTTDQPGRANGERNRRTRIGPTVDPEVKAWLRRIA